MDPPPFQAMWNNSILAKGQNAYQVWHQEW